MQHVIQNIARYSKANIVAVERLVFITEYICGIYRYMQMYDESCSTFNWNFSFASTMNVSYGA